MRKVVGPACQMMPLVLGLLLLDLTSGADDAQEVLGAPGL